MPFFIGILLAYLLDPIVDWLESKNINRAIGAAITLAFFFIIISMISLLILPILLIQAKSFLVDFPEVVNDLNIRLSYFIKYIQDKIVSVETPNNMSEFLPNLTNFITNFFKRIMTSTLAIFNIITLLLITPIVSWYFLKDWDKIIHSTLSIIPSKFKVTLTSYAKNINIIFDSYLRGQILVSISLSIFYFISFFALGLNYSLFIGIFAGFFSFVPFVGIFVSLIITSLLAYLQFVEIYYLIYIGSVFLIAQLLESNLLTPKLIGKKLGLHPLIVLLSIFVFGAFFGILGIIFAAPLMATIILIFKKNFLSSNE